MGKGRPKRISDEQFSKIVNGCNGNVLSIVELTGYTQGQVRRRMSQLEPAGVIPYDYSQDEQTIKGLDYPIPINGYTIPNEGTSTHTDQEDTEAYMDKALWESGYLAGQIDERARWTVPVPQPDDHSTYAQPDIPFDEPPSGNGKLPPDQEEGYNPAFDEGYDVGYADGVRDITHGVIRHQLLDLLPPFNNQWTPIVQQQWFLTWGMAYMKGDQP